MEETNSVNAVLEKIRIASRKKRRKRLIILLTPIVIFFLAAGAYMIYRFYENIRPGVTLEAGSPNPTLDDFLYEHREHTTCDTDLAGLDMRKPGEHTIGFSWGFLHTSSKLIIRDTVAPVGETKDLMVKVGENLNVDDFLVSAEDVTDLSMKFSVEPDCSKEGVQNVSITLEDAGGNVSVLPAKLTVYDEKNVPIIKGAEDRTIYVGDTISYRSGITIVDALDENPTLEIDNSSVNMDVPGVYTVTYKATDMCGRSSSVSVKVHVEEKPANYQDIQVLNTKADELLKGLINDRMSDIDKAFAIFRWTRLQIPWIAVGSHDNDVDQAIMGLEGNSGDCYVHALVCKILLERVGFLVLMIEKKTVTGTHYWLKVNLDGSWYNMDPSPIYIRNFVPFLATDNELQVESTKYRPNLYALEDDPYPPSPNTSPVSVVFKDGDYVLTKRTGTVIVAGE